MAAFSGHNDPVMSVTFSPGGEQIVSASKDTIILWDTASGKKINTFPQKYALITTVEFSPDGKYLLSGSCVTGINLWDIETGKKARSYDSDRYIMDVFYAEFSPDGSRILSLDGNTRFMVWDINTGKASIFFNKVTRPIAISPDSKKVLFRNTDDETLYEYDGSLFLMEIDPNNYIHEFKKYYVNSTLGIFSADGSKILIGSRNGTLKLLDTASGDEIHTFYGHSAGINSVSFINNDTRILSSSQDGTVRLWDVEKGKEIAQFISFNDGEWIVITPDGCYAASPAGDRHLNVRVGNRVTGIDSFRRIFYNPDVVKARLQIEK